MTLCRSTVLGLACALGGTLLFENAQADSGRPPQVTHQYTLEPTSLETFGYTPAELSVAATFGLAVLDQPAIGSGVQRLRGNRYLGVTDRGPNFTVGANRFFPLPQYTPTIVLYQAKSSRLSIEATLPVVGQSGVGITGIPNSATEDSVPFLSPDNPLPFNPSGMDVEDIHTLPGGGFVLVEEYGPSVVIVDDNGVVQRRYTPAGKTFAGADYPVRDVLPAVLRNRRANRGFECVPISPDGRTAYVVTQSPMGATTAGGPYRESRVVRILRLDLSDPLNLQVTGQFVMRMSPATEYPAGNAQRDLKLSAGTWVSHDVLLLVELNDVVGIGGVRLLLVDLHGASNVHGLPAADTLDFEDVNKGPESLGVVPASTRVIYQQFETDAVRLLPSGKLEGITILNANQVAISNDNDFGVGDVPGAPSTLTVLRLGDQLPLNEHCR